MPQNTTTLKTQIKDASLTSNVNYLQPTGFRISIDRKRYPNLEYFVQSVQHPNLSVSTVELPVRRITSVPLVGDSIKFGSVDFTILLDEDMKSYEEMFDWMQRGVNEGQVSAENRRTAIPTYSDITLSILSSHNNSVRQITYRDCIPTDLGGVSFVSNSGDATFLTFTASFRFSQFEFK
jgi:hypothetical protein